MTANREGKKEREREREREGGGVKEKLYESDRKQS
jgi:hypothetical protein